MRMTNRCDIIIQRKIWCINGNYMPCSACFATPLVVSSSMVDVCEVRWSWLCLIECLTAYGARVHAICLYRCIQHGAALGEFSVGPSCVVVLWHWCWMWLVGCRLSSSVRVEVNLGVLCNSCTSCTLDVMNIGNFSCCKCRNWVNLLGEKKKETKNKYTDQGYDSGSSVETHSDSEWTCCDLGKMTSMKAFEQSGNWERRNCYVPIDDDCTGSVSCPKLSTFHSRINTFISLAGLRTFEWYDCQMNWPIVNGCDCQENRPFRLCWMEKGISEAGRFAENFLRSALC